MPTVIITDAIRRDFPGGRGQYLTGIAKEHPHCGSGRIYTSRIVRDLGNIVVTRNTIYVLQ